MNGENPNKLFYDAVRAEASGELDNAVQIYLLFRRKHILQISMQIWPIFFLK